VAFHLLSRRNPLGQDDPQLLRQEPASQGLYVRILIQWQLLFWVDR
jgi:hypothetical protein